MIHLFIYIHLNIRYVDETRLPFQKNLLECSTTLAHIVKTVPHLPSFCGHFSKRRPFLKDINPKNIAPASTIFLESAIITVREIKQTAAPDCDNATRTTKEIT